MDVQTDNMDPLPCETQPSGKIRKGFKLFGKRKSGNIFSIRSKGDNKSPVSRSKTLDGLSETASPDSEQEPDKEKGREESQEEHEQAEEERLEEDGVLAASAPARNSISSACSAKSLGFLSLMRGGRRGAGDRRVQTVSQPVARQRRGLKSLFNNVKFRSKDKEDKEGSPPSPLLMSSRANSVEIIKEDLPLTPKTQPRSLDSSDTCEPVRSSTTTDSAATIPSETVAPPVNNVPPSPLSELSLIPGDNSLSCLLADFSSILTFDPISGGGDIMADMEAEWGKASSAINAVEIEATPLSTSLFSRPTVSPLSTFTSFSTAAASKPSPITVPSTASTQYFTSPPKKTSTSSPMARPSSIITTLTKSSTLTTNSVKLSSSSTPASEPFTSIKIQSTPTATTAKSSASPVTLTSFSAPVKSSPSVEIKFTQSPTFAATAAPPNTPAAVVKAPTTSASVSKYSPVAIPPPAPVKPPPVTRSPPTPFVSPPDPPAKLDPASSLNLQTSTSNKPSLTSTAGDYKAPGTVSPACTITTKPPSPAPIPSRMTTVPITAATTSSVSAALSKPIVSSSPMDFKKIPPSLVTFPDPCLSSSPRDTPTTQPSTASVPILSPTSLDKRPPAPTPTPTSAPAPITHAVVSTATPPPLGQIPVSQSKPPPAPAPIPISLAKDLPLPPPVQVPQSKGPLTLAQNPVALSKDSHVLPQIPISVAKDLPLPTPVQVPPSKGPLALAQIPDSGSKDSHVPAPITVPESKAPLVPASIHVPVSKDLPAPASVHVSPSKAPPAPAHIPVSVSTDLPAPVRIPITVSKDPPFSAQIPVSQSKAPPAPSPAPCSVTSPPSSPWPSEAPATAKIRGSGQASVDRPVASPRSNIAQGAQIVDSTLEELHNESRTSLQGTTPTERKTPPVKASAGLSKIPIVGGGRGGKLPVRESHHVDDEEASSRDPPTPVLEEERPHFNSHDAGRKDKISDLEANVPAFKHSQGESQQLPQPKVFSNLPRDSKIPVKHGAQTASQIPQAGGPPRTKIPVSKVPVRRAGNKPVATSGIPQMRK